MRIPARVCGATLFVGLMSVASAQQFPTKPMKMIVPAPPSGSSDVLARLIAEHLQKRLGQPMVTENRAGAGQTIGSA